MIPIALADSFLPLIQVLTTVITSPTADTFQTLVGGWLMVPHRTIQRMVRASGVDRHHSAFLASFLMPAGPLIVPD